MLYLKNHTVLTELAVNKSWFKKNPEHKVASSLKFPPIKIISLINKKRREYFETSVYINYVFFCKIDCILINEYYKLLIDIEYMPIEYWTKILIRFFKFNKLNKSTYIHTNGIIVYALYDKIKITKNLISNGFYISDNQLFYNKLNIYKNNDIIKIREAIKNIHIDDIKVIKEESNDDVFYSFEFKNEEVNNILSQIFSFYSNKELSDFFIKIHKFRGYLNTEELPSIFYKTGLGFKFYKKMISDFGFARTSSTSDHALVVWKHLMQDKDFYHIIYPYNIALFYKHVDDEILYKRYEILIDNYDFTIQSIDPIFKKRISNYMKKNKINK